MGLEWNRAKEEAIEYADIQLPNKFALVDIQDYCEYFENQFDYLESNFNLVRKNLNDRKYFYI